MRIFLIAGKGSTGKHTIANIIKDYYAKKGEETVITEVSKHIKMFAKEISNWTGNEAHKPRELLQMIGSKVREELGEKFFVKRIVEDLGFYKLNYKNVIVADIRLPFEIEYLREVLGDLDIYAIGVTRTNKIDTLTEEEKMHETETALDNYVRFDYEIENNDYVRLKHDVISILEGIDSSENDK